eukprot:8619615-Alexandrium_andersonii.AAC.1
MAPTASALASSSASASGATPGRRCRRRGRRRALLPRVAIQCLRLRAEPPAPRIRGVATSWMFRP